MSKEVSLEHFTKAAREIGAHGDNDTLPFDLDNRFISIAMPILRRLLTIFSKP